MPRQILFLCTGNYYRSRFAEELFNHLAAARSLDWKADSRALAIELGVCNIGPISQDTFGALKRMGIELAHPIRSPRGLAVEDLVLSEHVIALKEAEHRPLLTARFPEWTERTEYWHVDDLDRASAGEALAQIERLVRELIARLETNSR
jgi:protein-tyrosine phosphatase